MQSNEETSGNPNLFPIIQHENVHVVDSRLIAEALGLPHSSWFTNVILKYQNKIEAKFHHLHFQNGDGEIQRPQGGGKKMRYALLTEDQAIFLATLSRNTEQVVEFKAKLVLSFAQVRQALAQTETLADELEERLDLYDTNFERILNVAQSLSDRIDVQQDELAAANQQITRANQQITALQNSQNKNKMVLSDTVERVDKIEEVLEVNAKHWTYVIYCQNRKIYKFGASNDVKERKSNFKTVAPNTEVYCKLPTQTRAEAFALEKTLKMRFAHRHLQNEWYALTEDDLHYLRELELMYRTHFTQVA